MHIQNNGFQFTRNELVNILVSVIAISLALTLAQANSEGGVFSLSGPEFIVTMSIITLTLGIGFILHELAHKYVAIRYGAFAQFQAWPMGLLLMFVMALFSPIIFISPGAVYIYAYNITRKQNGIISIAGPLTNVAVSLAFFALSFVAGGFSPILIMGAKVNVWLALFNMLLIPPLDGSKVYDWSKPVWAGVVFFCLAMMFLYNMSVSMAIEWLVLSFILKMIFSSRVF